MKTKFPDTFPYIALNKPIRAEISVRDLEVEGTIPQEIEGAFFRAVPDPAQVPMRPDDIVLSADGMVGRFLFSNGHVDFDIRYVRTARYEAERAARRSLFGLYRNPFTDDPSVKGVDRTVSNTTPLWHAGRLFMTKEDGHAYEINPHTLETIRPWDFHGVLKSQTMTAHSRVDPETGELFFFGYEAGGMCDPHVAYGIADKEGNLISEQWFKQPYLSLIHDFAITEKHAIFPVFPTITSLERLKAGGVKWAHEQEKESWVGIMPRKGKVEEMRWFKGPKGVSAFHLINAFCESDDLVHLDLCLTETNAFPFMREAGGIDIPQPALRGDIMRWSFDLAKEGDNFAQRPIGPMGDLPRIRDVEQGRKWKECWYLTMNPFTEGMPLFGGPVLAMFNALIHLEPDSSQFQMMPLDPGMGIHEPVHVPAKDKSHKGWLIFLVDRQVGDDSYESEVWIVDAGDITKAPVAKIRVPVPLRPQVHGCWVPAAELNR